MIIEEKHEPFNLVMANATESNMNALSILNQTGIPIILMSPERDMKTSGRAIAEWGYHFLEKPISMEDIELVWQIVYRKIRNPRARNLGENTNQAKKSHIGGMFGRVSNVAGGVEWNPIEEEEEEEEEEKEKCGDREARLKPSATVFDYLETMNVEEKTNRNDRTHKRSRIVWSSKLHRKFTEALSKLGNRKSSPKIILKMMNEPSLTLRQVASHLQKFKSQVKHLNKMTESDACTSLGTNQVQELPTKCNSMTNILGQPSYSSNITGNQLRQLQVPSCLNAHRLPSQDVFNCHLRMMNQQNSCSYKSTYGGFEGPNLVDDNNRIFTDELYKNESLSHSNFQYFGGDHEDCPFLSADNHYPHAVQELEFAQNMAGCYDVDNIRSGAHSVIAGSLNQNVALKELDDLLNNTEEDPMVYCCYDGKMNSFDIDQYSEWLNA
ncbi:two-component response regulator ORR24-like isoform X1 [Cucurbita pepo subsp. pepo]|uniref:two-component response regulator ORR24-like isoform X1 n=2 Tax=Cucurbita pepo subsp. pepo TaxID=3664 RepID=UPI000C9D4FC6|nr:two-component response regulator ORR24-like isoform X1 [Cucurbita pepo subsp. pepo]